MTELTLAEKLQALTNRVAAMERERSARPTSVVTPWRALSVDIESAETVGKVLRASAGAWGVAGIDARELCGIVTAQAEGVATVTLWGQWPQNGTVGTAYYPGAGGTLVTITEEELEDHQAWPIAYQVTPTMRLVVGLLPRLVTTMTAGCDALLGEVEVWGPTEIVAPEEP